MIASLTGRVHEIFKDSIVLTVGGVGLQVYVTNETREQCRIGETVFLFTQLIVREDSLTLFGFESGEERDYFGLLLGVNGMGPKLSLSVLSTLSPDAIRRAVFHEQVDVFSRVPGVGKKTAQKILLQLQDRLPMEAGLERVSISSDKDIELIEALTSLGYSLVEAQAAIQSIPRNAGDEVEERLRLALQYFT